MDNLLLFTATKLSHFEKLEDLLKALCKNGLKISPSVNYSKLIFNTWAIQYSLETKEYA